MAEEKDTKIEETAPETDVPSDTQEGTSESKDVKAEVPVVEAEIVGGKGAIVEDKPVEKKIDPTPAVAKTDAPKGEVKEVHAELEREYVVPLRRGSQKVPQYKRAKKAVKTLKEFLAKHMRVRDRDLRLVKVNIDLNNEIWFRGIKKPVHKIKVKAKKIDGVVYAELAELPDVVKYKRARLERRASKIAAAPAGTPAAAPHDHKHDHPNETDKSNDKDGDGVSDKKEESEDKKAGAELEAKVQKDAHKAHKHDAKAKSGKQEKEAEHKKGSLKG